MAMTTPSVRYAEIERETAHVRLQLVLDIDGGQRRDIATGIPFFDLMLERMAYFGKLNLGITAEGDLAVDDRHTVVEVGSALGEAIAMALQDGERIERVADSVGVVEEALVMTALHIGGRGGFYSDLQFKEDRFGGLGTGSVMSFFQALCQRSGVTAHIRTLAGQDGRNLCEACFQSFGLALHGATHVVVGRREHPRTSTFAP
ncbi:MAG: imidazoleglycerol-phosphate dehydratase [Fimbriimonadaceae bacterium]